MKHYSFLWSFLVFVALARFVAELELVVCLPLLGTEIWEHYQQLEWTDSSTLLMPELELHLHSEIYISHYTLRLKNLTIYCVYMVCAKKLLLPLSLE
jgi:hypothetical protein